MNEQEFNIWEGVYETWEQAPVDDAVFSSKIWVEKTIERTKKTLESYQAYGDAPPISFIHETALPLAATMISIDDEKPLRVLDYGGGMGTGFFQVKTGLSNQKLIEFHIVEDKAVCLQGRELLSNYPSLHFHQTIPSLPEPLDIIHLGSSLQYIGDWVELIKSLVALRPQYLILTDVFAGDTRSFVTIQNFYGKKIRFRFQSYKEFLSIIEQLNFRLIFKSAYYPTIFGKVGPLPMKNFDKKLQLEHVSQVIFKRMD